MLNNTFKNKEIKSFFAFTLGKPNAFTLILTKKFIWAHACKCSEEVTFQFSIILTSNSLFWIIVKSLD